MSTSSTGRRVADGTGVPTGTGDTTGGTQTGEGKADAADAADDTARNAKPRFVAHLRTTLDEIEQSAPSGLALFEYVDLLAAGVAKGAPIIRDLFTAAAAGDAHTTRALLLRQPGIDVDAVNEDGATPMYIAAAHGHTAVVEVLADEGHADSSKATPDDATLLLVESWKVNPPGDWECAAMEWERGRTHGGAFPLYIAARNGKVDTVRALLQRLQHGWWCQETTKGGEALHGACEDGRTDVIKILLAHGADVEKYGISYHSYSESETPLWIASKRGHVAAMKVLLDHDAGVTSTTMRRHGADVNKGGSEGGWSPPVHAAILGGHVEAVKILLAAGAKTARGDCDGNTPLLAAVDRKDCEILTVLLEHGGVDINDNRDVSYEDEVSGRTVYDGPNSTALVRASKGGFVEAITILLDHGADPNQADFGGSLPLCVAVEGYMGKSVVSGHVEAVKLLLTAGADVERRSVGRQTPFLEAAEEGHCEIITLIFDHEGGAATDINQVTDEDHVHPGSTALVLASVHGYVDAVKSVLDCGGADVNKAGIHGWTPVHGASAGGHAAVVKLLLAAGVATDGHNREGLTPFLAAARGGHCEATTLLLDHGGAAIDINQGTSESNETWLNGQWINALSHAPGSTALNLASRGGHTQVMQILLDRGANVSIRDEDDVEPLFFASEEGHTDAVKLLIKHKANVHRGSSWLATPVLAASMAGHADVVHVLLKAGADANMCDNAISLGAPGSAGELPLHNAMYFGHPDTVRVLAEVWPTNPLAWQMFLMGGGASSELQDYLAPPANRATRNYLPRLYSKPDMMKEVWKYLHKPRYADLNKTDGMGKTAMQVGEDELQRVTTMEVENPLEEGIGLREEEREKLKRRLGEALELLRGISLV